MNGAAIIPQTVKTVVRKVMSVKVALRNCWVSVFCSEAEASSSVFSFSRYFLKVGMKATEMLFSAKSFLKRLGAWNAKVKASERSDVPRKAAFVISLIRPRIRDISVRTERLKPDFNNDFLFVFSCVMMQRIALLLKILNACKIPISIKRRFF